MIESAEEFVRLRTSSVPEEYHRAAHEEATESTWWDVVQRFPDMRSWVAHNKTVPLSVLEVLRHDPDEHVRRTVRQKRSWARAHPEDADRPWGMTNTRRTRRSPAGPTARRRADVTDVELVGGVEKRELFLVEPDEAWPEQYAVHEARIRAAIGDAAVDVQHIGSTSVPGLAAKPIIDVQVLVEDVTAEEDYLAPLVAAGYLLRVREPGHRMVRTPELDVHVHVREVGGPGVDDYVLLRDRLRTDPSDRELYESTKRDLLAGEWPDMNAYADAKTAVIGQITARARLS